MNTSVGENFAIKCKYPDLFEENDKVFFKLENRSITEIINTGKESQKVQSSRFSISEDRRSKVFSVRISDVREDDGGVYYCGVWKKQQSDGFYSLYREIQLQVTAPGSSVIIIIITVCVCVALLLIGGSALIYYKVRCMKTQDSPSIGTRSGTNHAADIDYENDLPGNQNISMIPVYQKPKPNTKHSDSVYQSLNLNTNQPESVYQSLNPNTN
ncbi:hypothetical protein MHYP_G00103860 [Metynnis hypsauchen]